MRKNILLISLLAITTFPLTSYGMEIIYPKSENVTINSSETFFVGNEKSAKTLKINNNEVNLYSSGAFFYPVKLEDGENQFLLNNGITTKTYIITKPKSENCNQKEDKYINFSNPIVYITKKDNVPLRSVPYDGGLNRLQHLEKGIPLNIVGQYQDFYKVQLARDDYAWISKENVLKAETFNNSPARIENYVYEELPDKRIFTIKLSKKVPYILSEARAYKLQQNPDEYIPKSNGLDFVLYNVNGFYENKYEFHINKTSKSFGYNAYYKNSKELVIEVKNAPKNNNETPLKDLIITLDAGHGGDEYGAIGCLGDKEKDINLDITLKLKSYLENAGATVYLTRDSDQDVSLQDRVDISNKNKSDIFISIHNNALPDNQANSNKLGSSGYYFYPQSKDLATSIVNSLNSETGTNNDGVRGESFAVVRNTQAISVLIEVGYMIKPEDCERLIDPDFQDKAAKAIMHGVENYINEL
jgi:N-acetylmuramoyl-L-alanine amidase